MSVIGNALSARNIIGSLPFIGANYWAGQNYEQQQQNLEWQKEVQRTNWDREDTAVQRRVTDLRNAGLSPVLAAGSAAQSGPVVATQAPQRQIQDTGMLDAMSDVMAMMRQQVDISRTEAETDAIMAQADRTRVQTTIDDVLAKRQDEILSSQIGLQTANTSSASADAGLARARRLTEEHNLKLSQNAGTATSPSWASDVWRSITGQLNTPSTARVQDGINRVAQSTFMSLGAQVIKNDVELRQARILLQRMLNERRPRNEINRLERRIVEYENRRQRR